MSTFEPVGKEINLNDHVGKQHVKVSLTPAMSPTIELILEKDQDPEKLVKNLTALIHTYLFNRTNACCSYLEILVDSSEEILPEKERIEKRKQQLNSFFEMIRSKPIELPSPEELSDPNDGTEGYWKVRGIRHFAVVKASSAAEAAKKAIDSGIVQNWEMPSATFFGEDIDCMEIT